MIARLTLVAVAPTAALRALRFPPDGEAIEPLAADRAARLTAGLGRWSRAVRGPETRAAQTAAALGLDAAPTDGLRAWAMGDWTGRPVAEVAESEPEAFGAWRTDPARAAPGGEPFTALLARTGAAVDRLLAADGRVVAVADAAVIRAAVVHVLGAGHAAFWAIDVEPLSTTVLQGAPGTTRVRTVGAVSPGPAAPG
jgi:broad specificity phosphatase PhoE